MPTLDAVDVSTWQGAIDFAALPPLRFICAQVGVTNRNGERDRNELALDSTYRRNTVGARNAGIPLIHYYVPVIRPWQEQLDWFLAQVGPLPAGEGLMFDLEYSAAKALGWPSLMAMMDEAERRIGRPVLHYGELFDQSDRPERPKWCAHYGSESGMRARYFGIKSLTVWQYSGSGSVPGVTGPVDLNTILDADLLGACMAAPTMNPAAVPHLLTTWDIKNGAKRSSIRPRLVILHTNAAGGAASIAAVTNAAQGGGTQPHFQAQGGFHADGDSNIYQLLPTDREGVGSWDADNFAITIETQDNGAVPVSKLDATPWSPAQFEHLAQVITVECKRWGIPARLADRWDGTGIGYHRQWGKNTVEAPDNGKDWWGLPVGTVPGYVNPWTKTVGKSCPGDARVAQMPALVARVAAILAGTPEVPKETDVKLVKVAGDNAVFLKGDELRWIDNGPDEVALLKDLGQAATEPSLTKAAAKLYVLVGDVPRNATLPWAASDFKAVRPLTGTVGPKGDKGDTGDKGDKGTDGADGGLAPHTHTVSPPVLS